MKKNDPVFNCYSWIIGAGKGDLIMTFAKSCIVSVCTVSHHVQINRYYYYYYVAYTFLSYYYTSSRVAKTCFHWALRGEPRVISGKFFSFELAMKMSWKGRLGESFCNSGEVAVVAAALVVRVSWSVEDWMRFRQE